jgi:hypothetical protein
MGRARVRLKKLPGRTHELRAFALRMEEHGPFAAEWQKEVQYSDAGY